MSAVLDILRGALQDLWNDLWTTAVCNLLWLFAMLLVIPGPPATLALFFYGNRLAHGEVADIHDFLSAFRRYWGPAWRWGALTLGVIFILLGDFSLTGRLNPSGSGRFIQGFYLAALAAWLLVQLYALPLIFELEKPSVLLALRNAAVMLGRNLAFSVLLGALLAGLLLLGTGLFLMSVAAGGVLLASAGNRAVLNRLEAQQVLARGVDG
jgi:uncharacterized membrane protein YesL